MGITVLILPQSKGIVDSSFYYLRFRLDQLFFRLPTVRVDHNKNGFTEVIHHQNAKSLSFHFLRFQVSSVILKS